MVQLLLFCWVFFFADHCFVDWGRGQICLCVCGGVFFLPGFFVLNLVFNTIIWHVNKCFEKQLATFHTVQWLGTVTKDASVIRPYMIKWPRIYWLTSPYQALGTHHVKRSPHSIKTPKFVRMIMLHYMFLLYLEHFHVSLKLWLK